MKNGRNHIFSDLSPLQGDLHGAFGVGYGQYATFAAVTGQIQFNLISIYFRPNGQL